MEAMITAFTRTINIAMNLCMHKNDDTWIPIHAVV